MARAKSESEKDKSVVEVDEITLDGKRVVVRNQDLPVEALHLDPKNPRIANTVSLEFGPKAASLDSAIEELLWSDPDVRDLYRQVVVNGGASILEALELEERYQISFWDALVIIAAQACGAQVLYSEDLSDGQVYGSVRVVSPLAGGHAAP